MVYEVFCPGAGHAGNNTSLSGSSCGKRYPVESIPNGFVSKLNISMKEGGQGQEWESVRREGNPCSCQFVHLYLTFVSEEQRQVGVQFNQAAPMLKFTLIDLLSDMRSRAHVASSLAERIPLTRAYALFSLAFYSMRAYDLSFAMGSHILRLPVSRGLIFNFSFGKTLRASSEAVVVLADRNCPAIFSFRVVTAYSSAAQQTVLDSNTGPLVPVATAEIGRGCPSLSAARMPRP